MKTLIFITALLFGLSMIGCGPSKKELAEKNQLKNELDSVQAKNKQLEEKLESLPTQVEDSLRKLGEKRKTEQQKALLESLKGLNLTELSSNASLIICQALSLGANNLGLEYGNKEKFRSELSKPDSLLMFYKANKIAVKVFLAFYKQRYLSSEIKNQALIPFFEEKLPHDLGKKFQEIFADKDENNYYYFPWEVAEDKDTVQPFFQIWNSLKEELNPDKNKEIEYEVLPELGMDLPNAYLVWLFVQRRKAEGGDKLLATYAQILRDMTGKEPATVSKTIESSVPSGKKKLRIK